MEAKEGLLHQVIRLYVYYIYLLNTKVQTNVFFLQLMYHSLNHIFNVLYHLFYSTVSWLVCLVRRLLALITRVITVLLLTAF